MLETGLFQKGARAIRKTLNVALCHPVGLRPTGGGGSVGNEEIRERPAELAGAIGDHVDPFAITQTGSYEEVNSSLSDLCCA
eukprot:5401858-Alexandrium_andersonii.AAC.1